MDRIIGLELVPATVKRKIDARDGSMQWFVESMMPEAERLEKRLNAPDAEAWSQQIFRTRLFDQLIANADRSLLDRIAKLEKKKLQTRLGEYLTGGQIERVLQRRDAILELAAKRVKEKGEAAVLYK